MIRGTLVCESLRVGGALDGLDWVIRSIRRVEVASASGDQPGRWTLFDLEVDDGAAERLASQLSGVLDEPGWYVDYSTAAEKFVVFAGRVFRYPLGSIEGRRETADYARSRGVPEAQLDWPE
jgi:hypothetical protein